ncbi:MAG: ADP-ribose-binding protein [Candidatus Methanomethylicia archaeon]
MKFQFPNNLIIEVLEGDITEVEADAIVNAANRYLKHGGGVAGAIVRKGGIQIQIESDEYIKRHGPLPVGGVAVTRAGKLKAKYIIHVVGPVYGEENSDLKLSEAIRNSILKAEELNLESIAIPAISTGAFGYPLNICAEIMAETIINLANKLNNLKKIMIVLYGEQSYKIFKETFKRIFKDVFHSNNF